ncbi:MAG: NAD(P)-dependent oxidoreductase [Nitrospirales bacterium]|nr:NAD-dependent epimerase/dehydratase family protein [Nitrospira sp.]MDR4502088.1 NAD(P)-dependent oxidoreductase [Nitrospirales bacterium]
MLEHLYAHPVMPQRVVVIGAGGFVGGAIIKQLTVEGVSVLPIGRSTVDLLANDAAQKLRETLQPGDSVVLVSAQAPAKTVTMLMDNLRMIEPVCKVVSSLEMAHLLYISSDAVYADEANPVDEDSSMAPTTLHGMMHAARELMLKSSTAAPVACLRPTLIYGKADPHNGYGPNRFRRQAEKGEPIQIFGEGEEQRDHVLVDDVAKLASLTLAHRSKGSLNVVTGVSTSFSDIATMIAKQYGGCVVSQPRPGPRPHLLHRFFNTANCLKAFPTFRFTSLADGLLQVS